MDRTVRTDLESEAIRLELDRILASKIFFPAQPSQSLLRYVVERSLSGLPPKEDEIAMEVLGRGAEYDPAVDAAVRVEAGRLRNRLREYYEGAGSADPVRIAAIAACSGGSIWRIKYLYKQVLACKGAPQL